MIRCALVELFLPGGGFALRGHMRAAAIAILAMVLALASCLVTPLGLYALAAARLGSIAEAARRGRPSTRACPERVPRSGRVEGLGMNGDQWHWRKAVMVGAVGLGTLFIARMAVVEAFRVPTESMAPTIARGEVIVVDKLTLHVRAPERGEVIAFRMGGKTFVKRVIGLGGDHVAVRDGVVHVNGAVTERRLVASGERTFLYEERLGGHRFRVLGGDPAIGGSLDVLDNYPVAGSCGQDRYGYGTRELTFAADSTCVVPAGAVFVMGDNRVNSADSRYWGAVPRAWVFGRVVGLD